MFVWCIQSNVTFLRQLINCLLFSFAFDLSVLMTGVEKINLTSGNNLKTEFSTIWVFPFFHLPSLCLSKLLRLVTLANAIMFALFINSSDIVISDVVEITSGMDHSFILPDCALYIIYILTYACMVGVIIGEGVVVICTAFAIKVVAYKIFTQNNILYKIKYLTASYNPLFASFAVTH